jgi:hypothetical protein
MFVVFAGAERLTYVKAAGQADGQVTAAVGAGRDVKAPVAVAVADAVPG